MAVGDAGDVQHSHWDKLLHRAYKVVDASHAGGCMCCGMAQPSFCCSTNMILPVVNVHS